MGTQPLHSPSEAAALITDPRTDKTVNAHTLRRWCKEHKKHLSPGANPIPPGTRRLTDRDVEVLRTVVELRGKGQSTKEINDALANMSFAVVDNVDTHLDIEPTTPTTPQAAPAATETATAMLTVTVSTLERIAARMEAQEHSSIRQLHRELSALRLLVWIMAAIVLVLVVAVIALWVLQ